MALVDLSVVEQRYRAVLAVQAGEPAVGVAAQWGVSRQTVQNWLCRYREGGRPVWLIGPDARTGAWAKPARRWRR